MVLLAHAEHCLLVVPEIGARVVYPESLDPLVFLARINADSMEWIPPGFELRALSPQKSPGPFDNELERPRGHGRDTCSMLRLVKFAGSGCRSI